MIGIPDEYRGQSPKAFIALKAGAAPMSLDEMKAFLRDRIGKHEMIGALEIRASLPKTWPPASIDLEKALRLLRLPREVGNHPEDGQMILAGIGRYGPYVQHAGTYANADCAVSGTGWGEFYIRAAAAHDICARMAYLKETPQQAGEAVINQIIPGLGGDGGAIVLGSDGAIATPFNTEGMYRGWIGADGVPHVALYSSETLPAHLPAGVAKP